MGTFVENVNVKNEMVVYMGCSVVNINNRKGICAYETNLGYINDNRTRTTPLSSNEIIS